MAKQVIGQFQDADQAARAIHELVPVFRNRISVVHRGPKDTNRVPPMLDEAMTAAGVAFGVGTTLFPGLGAALVGGPAAGYLWGNIIGTYMESGAELNARNQGEGKEEADNEREAITARYSSTLVFVDPNEIDRDEAERILTANGGTLISSAKAAALDNDDPYVTAEPIEPYSPQGYIDPNIGLGNYGIVDPLKE